MASPTVAFSLFFHSAAAADAADGYRILIEASQMADKLGFEAVWIPERHFQEFGGLYPNAAVPAAAVAAVTARVALRAGSVILPLHHPVRVMEEWSAVDNLSHGRVGVSFSPGWVRRDFVIARDAFGEREAGFCSALGAVRDLWRGAELEFRDPEGVVVPVRGWPRPVQPDLPTWIASVGSRETFELAGELGAGVLTSLLSQDVAAMSDNVEAYRRSWRPSGAPPRPHVTLMIHTLLGPDARAVHELARPALGEYLRSYAEMWLGSVAPGGGLTLADLDAADLDFLVERAFARYARSAALFGTVETVSPLVEQLGRAGVDEIACLVDFGVEPHAVLAGLDRIAELSDRFAG